MYVAFAESGLVILNVSDPTNPVKLSSIGAGWWMYDLAISGDLACATIANPVQIKVIDISDPEHPVLVSTYRPPRDMSFLGIAARGTRCYTVLDPSDDWRGGLQVVDVSDPANPSLAGSFGLPQDIEVIATADTLAFAGLNGGGVQVFSIADPSHIYLLGETGDTSRVEGLCVDLPYVYATVYNNSNFLQVIDVSDPRHPVVVGTIDTTSHISGIAVESGFAYVSASKYLRVIDVSTPTQPVQVAKLQLPSSAFGLDLNGDYCYVANWYGGIQVVDVSSPSDPRIVGSYPTPVAAATDIVVRGQYAYYTDGLGFGGLDVSDPTRPESVFYDWIPNQVWGIAATSELLCVTLLDSGIRLYDYADPTRPVVVGHYRTPFWAHKVSMVDRVVYVADRAGFCIIQYGEQGIEEDWVPGRPRSEARVLGTVAGNTLQLDLDPARAQCRVAVLDVTGRTRCTRSFTAAETGQGKVTLDVSRLPAGVYFVEVRGQPQRRVLKVLLAR